MGVWHVVNYVLAVIRVIGGVLLWVVCVFVMWVLVSGVHPVEILSTVFCVIYR